MGGSFRSVSPGVCLVSSICSAAASRACSLDMNVSSIPLEAKMSFIVFAHGRFSVSASL